MIAIKKADDLPLLKSWVNAVKNDIDRLHQTEASGGELWALLPSSKTPLDKRDENGSYYSKEELREALFKEQFGLCCYCMNAIKNEPLSTKIEHFLPKETYKPNEIFEYKNLFAACNGGEKDTNYKPRILHCDSEKGSKKPHEVGILSPLDITDSANDGTTHFLFLEDGQIIHKTKLGETTIKALNLKCKRLILLREAAIETYLYDETLDFKHEIAQLSIPKNGYLVAFCGAIIQVLENYK